MNKVHVAQSKEKWTIGEIISFSRWTLLCSVKLIRSAIRTEYAVLVGWLAETYSSALHPADFCTETLVVTYVITRCRNPHYHSEKIIENK
jgi:hypothetical protein